MKSGKNLNIKGVSWNLPDYHLAREVAFSSWASRYDSLAVHSLLPPLHCSNRGWFLPDC